MTEKFLYCYPNDYNLKSNLVYCYYELDEKNKVLKLIEELWGIKSNDFTLLPYYFCSLNKTDFLKILIISRIF